MANFARISSKVDFIGHLNPKAWDALIPKFKFTFSDAHVDLLVADLVRDISTEMPAGEPSQSVFALSQRMAHSASSALASSWEPGDELCPPWRFPFPPRSWWFEEIDQNVKPQPQPWKPIRSAEWVQAAYLLTQAAALTSNAEFSQALVQQATSLARSASQHLVDDFERCGTKPRPKFPKKSFKAIEPV